MLEANIKKQNNKEQFKNQYIRKQRMNYKQVKMTLQQYLQSVNLKKKIKSRSKSRQNPIRTQQNNQKNLLQPEFTHKTIQYYKLNQQWKAKNTFNSWIINVKQLCREYIQKDQHYIQIIRIIDKMAEFVKKQIQSFKKDNLLLESYLVTQASYWPLQTEQKKNNENVKNKDFDRLFQHIPIGKSQFYISTQKKIQGSHQKSINHRITQNIQRQNRSSTEPKIILNNPQNSKDNFKKNKQNTYRTSSTSIKNDNYTTSIQSRANISKAPKLHHIYSFQDKNSQSQNNSYYQNEQIVNEFFHHQEGWQKKKYLNIGSLGLKPIEQQIPRLSLMSKYEHELSQRSTKSEIQQNPHAQQKITKIPLRDRKYINSKNNALQKFKQPVQINNDFDQIFIKLQSPQKQCKNSINHKNIIQMKRQIQKSQQRINNSKYHNKNTDKKQLKQHSPLISQYRTRQSYDQTITLETPTTLKRNHVNQEKQSLPYKNIQKKNEQGQKGNQIKSSREDIMKRYDTFRNLE